MLLGGNPGGLLVGPDGRWLRRDSKEFLEELLDDPEPDYDAVLFAVKNLGFVHLTREGPLLRATLHPRNVRWLAMDASISLIAESIARQFTVRHLQLEWQQDTVASARDATQLIFDLCGSARGMGTASGD